MARRILLLIIITFAFAFAEKAIALSVGTHRQINEYIAENTFNGFSLNTVLIEKLNFSDGKEQEFNGRTVKLILGDGGEYEDVPHIFTPYLRSFNHYHDPLNNSGYLGDCGMSLCVSSISWMLSPRGSQGLVLGNYSWFDVRDDFYRAMTSYEPELREHFFAETFRGLGQLMHLVQDASVPAHTRNDGHLKYNYEDYVKQFYLITTPSASDFFRGTIKGPESFIDTNQYVPGTVPEITLQNTVGLSEFSNANFFSEDTIFNGYANPDRINTDAPYVESVLAADGIEDRVEYVHLNGEYFKNSSVAPYKLAGVSFAAQYTEFGVFESFMYLLDDQVYADYATRLIPRAVGYSADMLKYFFRGDITLIKNSSGEDVIKNNSGDALSGTFTLYSDDASGIRHNVGVIYSGSIPKGGESAKVTITAPTDHTPAEPGKYMLVFKGDMGGEAGAVAANVVKLNQPSYVFIIQETAEINTTPVETYVTQPQYKYVAKTTTWDPKKQRLAGRFKTFKDVKKIEVLVNGSNNSNVRFFVDDQLVSGFVWERGENTTGNPKKWVLEADPSWHMSSWEEQMRNMKLKVTLSDDNVFVTRLFSFGYAGLESANRGFASHCAYNFFVYWKALDFGIYGALDYKFKFIDMGGYTSLDSNTNVDCYNGESHGFTAVNINNDYTNLYRRSYTFIGKMYEYPYEYPFTNFYALELQPYLDFSPMAHIERVYSTSELAELKAIGVTPEYYTIELR